MPTIRPKSAAQAGLSRSVLYRSAKSGEWERIGRGLYLPVDAPATDWDQLEAVMRRPEATICLISALAHYDLTDEIPSALEVAIPRGTRAPVTDGVIRWRHFDRKTFELGREKMIIPGSDQSIGIYTPERTIVDCYRLRSSVGYEVGRDALKEWLHRGGKPAQVMKIAAQLPRAKTPLLQALEVLT